MSYMDLHMHTRLSDGLLPPAELVALMAGAGVSLLAITDHDRLDAYGLAQEAAGQRGVTLVAGVELSTVFRERSLHILGYGFEPSDGPLSAACVRRADERRSRMQAMLERLAGVGIAISLERVEREAAGAALARPHLARVLVAEGHVRQFQEAFQRFLGPQGTAYVPSQTLAAPEAIALLHQAGGIASLAHPGATEAGPAGAPTLDDLLPELADLGLDAIEVYHPSQDDALQRHYLDLARALDLGLTGGSDFHGQKPRELAHPRLPLALWPPLARRLPRRTAAGYKT